MVRISFKSQFMFNVNSTVEQEVIILLLQQMQKKNHECCIIICSPKLLVNCHLQLRVHF